MKTQTIVGGIAVAVLAVAGVWAYSSLSSDNPAAGLPPTAIATPPASASTTDGKKSPDSETLTGTIACLPHAGDGPHTMECAIGIKTDAGTYYALTNFAYPDSADVGDRVRLLGVGVTTGNTGAQYDIAGTFQVATVEKL